MKKNNRLLAIYLIVTVLFFTACKNTTTETAEKCNEEDTKTEETQKIQRPSALEK